MNKQGTLYKLIRACYRATLKPVYLSAVKKSNARLVGRYVPLLNAMKDIHKGKRCFIIGNGPSLLVSDLEKLNHEICFSSHRIYEMYDKTNWRPTYYCAQDFSLIMDSAEDINNKIEQTKFIAMQTSLPYPELKDSYYVNFINQEYFPELPKFSDDVSKAIYQGYTVTYMCLQIAVYMGFKEIFLLGVDHNYSISKNPDGTFSRQDVPDHFSSNDQIANIPELYKSTLAYEAAKQYADAHGIKIYNATRGGKLEVFERVDFDALFSF